MSDTSGQVAQGLRLLISGLSANHSSCAGPSSLGIFHYQWMTPVTAADNGRQMPFLGEVQLISFRQDVLNSLAVNVQGSLPINYLKYPQHIQSALRFQA